MAKSSATDHAMSVVAHGIMARSLELNVENANGFYAFWLKKQTPKDRDIMSRFMVLSGQAKNDLLHMLKQGAEGNG